MSYYAAGNLRSSNIINGVCILTYEDGKLILNNKDLISYAKMYSGSIPIFFEILREYFTQVNLMDAIEINDNCVFVQKEFKNAFEREIAKIAIVRCSMEAKLNMAGLKSRLNSVKDAITIGTYDLFDSHNNTYTMHSIINGIGGWSVIISRNKINEEMLNEKIDEIVPKIDELNNISRVKR
jgi:predicted DNA binding protein